MAHDNELRQVALKRLARSDKAIKTLDKNNQATAGAVVDTRKRLNETNSRLVEVAAKTTKRFDAMRAELHDVAAKNEIADLTRRANAALQEVEELRTRALNALYADYWDNHFTPLKEAYDEALNHATEEFSAADQELHAVMTKKSLAIRKLEDKPDSAAYKSARASYGCWKKAEFEPKRKANFAALDKAKADALAAFNEGNDAAYATYCARDRQERQHINPILADAKAVVAGCAELCAGNVEAADAIASAALAETPEGITLEATISDSNGQRREIV